VILPIFYRDFNTSLLMSLFIVPHLVATTRTLNKRVVCCDSYVTVAVVRWNRPKQIYSKFVIDYKFLIHCRP